MNIQMLLKSIFIISTLVSVISLGNLYAMDSSEVAIHRNFNHLHRNNIPNQNLNGHNNNPTTVVPVPTTQNPTVVVPTQTNQTTNQTPQDIYNQNQNTQKK